DIRSFKLSYVFQFYNLVANLTVEENILLPIELSGRKTKDHMGKVNELLELTGLTAKRNHYPSQLSGGQQQRCSIARAVLTEPEILLADEATGNLDKASGEEIMELFRRLNQEKGLTILQVTHSAECAAYGSRIVRLEDRKLVEVN
ncbi:ABC transporter, partial [Ruminococcaceae bacterium FB2012]